MRRYLGRLAFALAILFTVSTKFVDVTVGAGFGRHPLETAWSATGLQVDRFALDYWATGMDRAGHEDPGRLAKRLGGRLGVRQASIFQGEAAGIRFANLDGQLPGGGELVLTIQGQPARIYLGISCYYDHLPADLLGLERRIRLTMLGLTARGEFAWTLCGRQPGHLQDEAWRAMWVRVLNSINASRRGDEPGDELIEAFSPLLPLAPTEAGRTEFNLTLTRRYDCGDQTTEVTLASPTPAEP